MAGNRALKAAQENLKTLIQAKKFLSFADAAKRSALFSSLQLKNEGDADLCDVEITVSCDEQIIVEGKRTVDKIPFKSSVEVLFDCLLSPLYFLSLAEPRTVTFTVTAAVAKKVVVLQKAESVALPFDWWGGIESDAAALAAFVRPRLSDCDKVLALAAEQLKKWKTEVDTDGYAGADKTAVRRLAAAIFMAVRRAGLQKNGETYLKEPLFAGGEEVWRSKSASSLSLAVFVCSCFERAGLHPLLLLGERAVACGVWLYDGCFLETVGDDMSFIGKYCSEGINNLSFFDVEDLFGDPNVGYPTSEAHCMQKLAENAYESVVDIRRCRIEKILPLPLRSQGEKGYELLDDEATGEKAPGALPILRSLRTDGKPGKNKGWERKLLDLSMKNALLNFDPRKNALHVVCADVDETFASLSGAEKVVRSAAGSGLAEAQAPRFNASSLSKNKRELVALENENGILRVYDSPQATAETFSYLARRGKAAREESGTVVLYCAFGFLKWQAKEDGKNKYAPLLLQPVSVRKNKGSDSYSVVCADDADVNATLLEFLKQEFDVDIRGLDGDISGLKPSEILAMVRLETVKMKGWEVLDDAYFACFSFSGYLMWNDVKKNIGEFRKNPLIASLLNNRNALSDGAAEEIDEDKEPPQDTLTPLPADSSQYEAIALSRKGKTFVLHGPPGTGKSQTITNIIANALSDGKRVLFVAEKKAALDVVKKRLDSIGVGNFCFELNADKSEKSDFARKIEETLALSGELESGSEADFSQSAESIFALRKEIDAPLAALHKKRRLGVSVYEAALLYLQNKNAPEILHIESTFYDGLSEEKMREYENLLSTVSAAAKECGGVYNSPFEGVERSEYSQGLRDGVYCACEVMLAEIKHLKNYLGLFLELYRQRISTFTARKISLLKELIVMLTDGSLDEYFAEDEKEFYAFYNANRRLDASLTYYYQTFRALADIRKEYPKMGELIEKADGSYFNYKELTDAVKKLCKVAKGGKMPAAEAAKYLPVLYDIYAATERIKENTSLSRRFTGMFGGIDEKKRAEFLEKLYRLHEIGGELFMDYNADSFNGTCHRAEGGCFSSALEGLALAVESFEHAEERFLSAIGAEKPNPEGEDILDYYTAKASALIDNIDMLANWCNYRASAKKLQASGLKFIVDALESGRVSGENVVSAFRKNVYRNFLDINVPADPVLSSFSAAVLEETVEQFRLTYDKFNEQACRHIRRRLISRLPAPDTEGPLSLELVALTRAMKGKMRGMGVRSLLKSAPELMKVVAPCMLMSPLSVAQYLEPEIAFDLVIFDEASQMPTSEAVGALARAKSAIVVGDPKQLPPTSFFSSVYLDEENPENEDMESVLDDCLALGIPQRHLRWHYRSKHESLIAFSNAMYYGGKLCTFPSPDSLDSKVKFCFVENGVYDRGGTKRNEAEADALIGEVIRRLQDPVLSRSSMGVVTFSEVQKDYIERRLARAIAENNLEEVAYEREEGLFVKNLENVQGDERDVVLFSVCYGPDRSGKLSLNFGPLNQTGGWRRLNVAVSRAREEMVVFSSMTSALIDLSRTGSKGVAGLKAFLEFAQKGRTSLCLAKEQTRRREGVGKYIAEELSACGYDCRTDVGASDFKIDVAVVDPKNKSRFILAILLDSSCAFSCKDRNVLQPRILKRNNWNVVRLYCVNYYNNPKREIKKIKEFLDRLLGTGGKGAALSKAARPYRAAKIEKRSETASYLLDGENAADVAARLKAVVQAEEPIGAKFLKKRVLSSLGIAKYGAKAEGTLDALIAGCNFRSEVVLGETYYRKTDKYNNFSRYRVEEGEPLRKADTDFTPYEIVAFARAALEDKVALYIDELVSMAATAFRVGKANDKFVAFVARCLSWGEKEGLFVRSVSDRISLA